MDDFNIIQLQVDFGLHQKPGFFAIAVDQGEPLVRRGDGEWNAGQACAAADIQHGFAFHIRLHHQAVEQVFAHHFFNITNRG